MPNKPETDEEGKVVPGFVFDENNKEKLQALADNYYIYEAVLNQQRLELNTTKEELSKTQELPEANFDGRQQEGSDLYRGLTSSLNSCIRKLDDMLSEKNVYGSSEFKEALNSFASQAEEYVKNRQGTISGPASERGKKRLALAEEHGISKISQMAAELDQYAEKVRSDVVVDTQGRTFNQLNPDEKKAYIQEMERQGIIEKKPQEEYESLAAADMLKQISVTEYAERDYSGKKREQYMEAARDVILGRHSDVVNGGERPNKYDVIRIRNFDRQVQSLADNSVFRYLIDHEGVEATTKRWPAVEQESEDLRGQFREYHKDLLTFKDPDRPDVEEKMTIPEYVSGLGPVNMRSEEDVNSDPESEIRSMKKSSDELEDAYDRLTKIVATKILTENNDFGKEFLNAIVVFPEEKRFDVYDKLEVMTKQYLKANHALEGNSLSKTLEQAESGKLGEKVIGSIKDNYRKEKRRQREQALNTGTKEKRMDTGARKETPKQMPKEELKQPKTETKTVKPSGPAMK